ncbi:maltose acetyltransferase domain-containing protein [Ralstonia syzygii]|uniref:Maltose/galactoside acetyltransferase domain-containing protein n=1 Tax=Ralstonia syzygii R24 TaxID=907261 RepID=G2ZZA4_9RALS|nr:maltose acetyltransferase domain-containing protein [Ralstonia syzygii]CCA84200.1 hypothetical protein RALSY_10161 [Ralstonia syzygii R24]
MDLEQQFALISTGRTYNDLTPEWIDARGNAVFLTNEYNAALTSAPDSRIPILQRLLGAVVGRVGIYASNHAIDPDERASGGGFARRSGLATTPGLARACKSTWD